MAGSRDAARRRAITALRSYAVLGIRTNIPFLIQLLEHPDFVAASIDTGWLDREGAMLAKATQVALPAPALAALEFHRALGTQQNPTLGTIGTLGTFGTDPFVTLKGFRV